MGTRRIKRGQCVRLKITDQGMQQVVDLTKLSRYLQKGS